jgi:tRNA nucleotidyltransferase/poly(A) polymerase
MAPDLRIQPPFPVDPAALDVLHRLWEHGHAAYLVGGTVRDGLLDRATDNSDLSTDAVPERVLELFPNGTYQNRFGTVLVDGAEITTFRQDHRYGDHRRPDEVTFTDDPVADLARRDFTVNAIAWGRRDPHDEAGFLDPIGGREDLDARILRAVGDPDERFGEDALRLLRAARLAPQVGLTIEPDTLAAMARHAADVEFVSPERVGAELRRLLAGPAPSTGLRILHETGLLASLMPQLAAQEGIPQAKIPGKDLWEHTLATVDAAAALSPADEAAALTALLHDVGKPTTYANGHFIGHAAAGAKLARGWLGRIAYPSREAERIARLIEEHMFDYSPRWSDAAVRRFMRRVGMDLMDDLLRLRAADNVGSGHPPDAGGLDGLRARIAEQRRLGVPLSLADLAVDGDDVLQAVGQKPGPWLGALLARLLDSVVNDPRRNTRDRLLGDAREWARHEHGAR